MSVVLDHSNRRMEKIT